MGPHGQDGLQAGPWVWGGLLRKGRIPGLEKLRGRMWRKEQGGSSVNRTGIQSRACNRNKVETSALDMEQNPEPSCLDAELGELLICPLTNSRLGPSSWGRAELRVGLHGPSQAQSLNSGVSAGQMAGHHAHQSPWAPSLIFFRTSSSPPPSLNF